MFLYSGYPEAGEFFQKMILLGAKNNPMCARLLFFIQCSKKLYKTNNGTPFKASLLKVPRDYRLILINRDCDIQRLSIFKKKAAQFGIQFIRSPGIDCTNPEFDFTPYKEKLGKTFYNKTIILKGGLGCFLGHYNAWQRFYSEKNAEFGLICEDDARILGPLPMKFKDLDLPADADLIFVNQRMSDGLLQKKYMENLNGGGFLKIPVKIALQESLKIDSPISGPGGDGYILTRKGVEKLLRIYSKTKINMDVDWFLLFQSLTDEEIKAFLCQDGTDRFGSLDLTSERLSSYVLLPSLVEQAQMGSSRKADDPDSYLEISKIIQN